MTCRARIALAGAALLALARLLRKTGDRGYQGWVEADFIFVSPDEAGRVETLSVREGDPVDEGRAAVHARCRSAAGGRRRERGRGRPTPSMTYERAQELLKTAVGTQKAFDDAEAALRTARGAAQLGADAARPAQAWRARSPAPSRRSISGPARWCRPAGRSCRCCRRATSRCASSCRRRCCRRSHIGDAVDGALRRLRERSDGARQLHLAHGRVHAAGHLQPGGARQARVPDRGAARAAGRPARRPAGRRRLAACAGASHARK